MVRGADVVVVAMPWASVLMPSIQLGTLVAVLRRDGVAAEARSFHVAWLDHVARSSPRTPGLLDEYRVVGDELYRLAVGDWVFAVPPYRDPDPARDAAYLAFLREHGVGDDRVERVLALRGLVPPFLEACAEDVLASGAKVVGFTTAMSQTVPSVALARLLKAADPSIRVVFGGANCEGPMGRALATVFPEIDVVVRGEGEPVVTAVARSLLAGRPPDPLPGLCFRRDGEVVAVPEAAGGSVAMDDVPTPDFDEHFDRLATAAIGPQLRPLTSLVLETARGCWYGAKRHCTFCGLNDATLNFRSKSPARVVEDMDRLARRHRCLDVAVVDNILDMAYLDELPERLRAAGLELRLAYEIKANVTLRQLQRMREMGIRVVQPGIESLDTDLLRLVGKGVTALQNVRLLKYCAGLGIAVEWNLICGLPGEPAAAYERMADLVPSLTHLTPPSMTQLRIDRFSPYHERPDEHGVEILGPLPAYAHVFDVPDDLLWDLAYFFRFRHRDPRPGPVYVRLREAVDAWVAGAARSSLRYRRGPGFLVVYDRRADLPRRDHVLAGADATAYLALENGATWRTVDAALAADGWPAWGEDGLAAKAAEWQAARLVMVEDDRVLSLAVPEAGWPATAPPRSRAEATAAGTTETAGPPRVLPVRLARRAPAGAGPSRRPS